MTHDALVLVDPEHAGSAVALWRGLDTLESSHEAEIDDRLDEFEGGLLIVHGSDGLLSRALSIWFRDRSRRVRPLTVALAPVSESSPVARAVGGTTRLGTFGKAVRKLAETAQSQTTTRLRTLEIVDSTLPWRRFGFNIGFGQLAALDPGGGLTELAERAVDSGGDHSFRWVVDGEPRAATGYLLVSSLKRSFAGVGMGMGCTMRSGGSVASLVPSATRLGRLVNRTTGIGSPTSFDRIHIDGARGYLLDGIALTANSPSVIDISEGPRVTFARIG